MKDVKMLAILVSLVIICVSFAVGQEDSTRVFRSTRERPLMTSPGTSPEDIVVMYLQAHGRGGAAKRTLVSVEQYSGIELNITHVRMEQRVAGLWVYGSYVKAAVTSDGALLHLIDNTFPVDNERLSRPLIDESQALEAAIRSLYPSGDLARPEVLSLENDTTTFRSGSFFYTSPAVQRVAVPIDGRFETGFLVQTWTRADNDLNETLVGGDGRIISVEHRTNKDSYNVFARNPDVSAQTVMPGPGSSNAQSPAGWLFSGGQSTINVAGNNAHAYLDADANNAPDAGGTPVTDGNFLTAWNGGTAPADSANRAVAVQNLFYHNNRIHDILYSHGFTEATGNFQENNFGLGSRRTDGDSVNAEAQDGSGTDNANFATPKDGSNPRMQMYLWSAYVSAFVTVNSAQYNAAAATFGAALTSTGINGSLAIANDGTGTTTDACEALTGSFTGKIVVIDRGTCNFTVKVKNAQNAGAVGAIVVNNVAGNDFFSMGGTDSTITIPSVMVGNDDGATIKASAGAGANLKRSNAIQRDGDLDTDVVYHEYGHGLTWRMIGRMDGAIAGAIGEGMSDVLAMLINNDNDRIGEYSFGNSVGIRRYPYGNYPLTYADVTGGEVHDDGEIYGAIGWQMKLNYADLGLSADTLLGDLVNGMNYTPAKPSFEQMRDGILQGVSPDTSRTCAVWHAFAKYGVGVGSSAKVQGSKVTTSPSSTTPAQCP